MSDLRAKFRVWEVAELKGPKGQVISQRIKLSAVYSNTEENKKWAMATPSGQIEITIDNPLAYNILNYGDEVYIDFHVASTQPIGPSAIPA